jgi:Ca2+-binding EF-hand superfamily protein
MLQALGLSATTEDVHALFVLCDVDGDGTVSFHELFEALRRVT